MGVGRVGGSRGENPKERENIDPNKKESEQKAKKAFLSKPGFGVCDKGGRSPFSLSSILSKGLKKSEGSHEKTKDAILGLQKQIMAPGDRSKVLRWEDRIEYILQLKDLKSQTKGSFSSKEAYVQGKKEVSTLKPAAHVMHILMSPDPELDRTRIMHLLEPQIPGIRELTYVGRSLEAYDQRTVGFVKGMEATGTLDKIMRLETLKGYQEEKIQKEEENYQVRKVRLLSPEEKKDAKGFIQILEGQKQSIENQLDGLYGEIERGYFKTYRSAVKELNELSPEGLEGFLAYIEGREEGEPQEATQELKSLLSWLIGKREGEPPLSLNVNFLGVTKELLKGFLYEKIEGALAL